MAIPPPQTPSFPRTRESTPSFFPFFVRNPFTNPLTQETSMTRLLTTLLLSLPLTAPASLAGLPVLTIPVPLNSGLTAGLQIILPSADSPAVPWLLSR